MPPRDNLTEVLVRLGRIEGKQDTLIEDIKTMRSDHASLDSRLVMVERVQDQRQHWFSDYAETKKSVALLEQRMWMFTGIAISVATVFSLVINNISNIAALVK